jgi:AcrR family transcriptional regulator
MMTSPGRRPGRPDTRGEILQAARQVFGEIGYARASIRSIAARAGVDPSLVHHYFPGGKATLFAELMQFRRDPRAVAEEAGDGPDKSAAVVRGFLLLWEGDGREPGAGFRSLAEAMCAAPPLAAGVREFLAERIWSSHGAPADDVRHALVASQLVGLAFARYVLQLEPLASAPIDTVAGLVAPTLQHYMTDPVGTPLPDHVT